MKTKSIFLAAVALLAGAGVIWLMAGHSFAPGAEAANGRKALYYTCAMHPWVRESKPGPCPVCGMNLTPVYAKNDPAGAAGSNTNAGEITLESENISAINVQTDLVARRPVRRGTAIFPDRLPATRGSPRGSSSPSISATWPGSKWARRSTSL